MQGAIRSRGSQCYGRGSAGECERVLPGEKGEKWQVAGREELGCWREVHVQKRAGAGFPWSRLCEYKALEAWKEQRGLEQLEMQVVCGVWPEMRRQKAGQAVEPCFVKDLLSCRDRRS